ncbi:MAG TPA: energy transducer TonB, partial [Planctomycetota bacterium]|nr:energy transducer TonB [Planctomycetota bacterium]
PGGVGTSAPAPGAPGNGRATGEPGAAGRGAALREGAPPAYPEEARRFGEEGDVVLRIHVGADGRVDRVETVSAASPRLARAAGEAVRRWRFDPALEDGRPAAATVLRRFVFRLRDAR